MKKIQAIALALTVATITLVACGCDQGSEEKSDRIVITSLYYEDLAGFEELVETTYPDIDLQMEISQMSTYNGDALRRLRNGHGKDVVFTSMPNGDMANYMLDLSANAFTGRYSSSTMENVSQDGKTVYLPMPSVYHGFIVNKTLVDELGLALPTSQQEFFALMEAAKEQNIGVDEDGFCFATMDIDGVPLGEMVLGSAVPDFLGTMDGEYWAHDFVAKEAEASGTLNDYLQFFVSLCDQGYMDAGRICQDTMTKDAAHANLDMAERNLIACYGSSDLLGEIRDRNTQDEFVMMPFLSTQGNQSWISTTPASYVGVNAAVASDPQKLDAILRVFELFSTPKGQAAILADTRADSSYLTQPVNGDKQSDTGLESYVDEGFVYNMNRFDSEVLWVVGKSISDVCNGTITMDEAMATVDALNQGRPISQADEHTLIGSVSEDLLYENYNIRKEETPLGNLIADAVREYADVDMAFVNGGGVRASLYAGDVFTSDVAETCPYANKIVILDVKGDVIYQMLENSISEVYYQGTPGGRFLQVSGLSYAYSVDPDSEVTDVNQEAPAQTRLLSVSLPDGTPLDRKATYRIAVNDYMCGQSGYESAGDNYTMLNVLDEKTPMAEEATLVEVKEGAAVDALVAYFLNHNSDVIHSSVEGRIVVEKE